MPRRPMIIFDETVIAGTVLLLIPFLKSSTLSAAVEKISSTGGGVLTPRFSHLKLPLEFGGAPIGLICRSELCREQSPLAAPDIFFDGLLVDIAGRFDLLRLQGRTQVDDARRIARAYGAVIRIAG